MRILLTGATGFIGTALSRTLINQGHGVYAWVRNMDKARTVLDARIHCFTQLQEMPGLACDAVINLAGEPIVDKRWTASRKQLLFSSRVDLTYKLAEFISTLDIKPKVILSGSAIGYYGSQPADVTLDEDSDVVEGFPHTLCADWESAAMSMASETCRVCLLRTGVVLDTGGGALARMLAPFKLGLGGPVASGQQIMSWIHRQDWINAVLFLLSHHELAGPFNLVSPNPVSNQTFTRALSQALHRPAIFRVPCFALKLALGEAAELLCEGQRVVPKKLLDAGFQFEFSYIDQAFENILKSR